MTTSFEDNLMGKQSRGSEMIATRVTVDGTAAVLAVRGVVDLATASMLREAVDAVVSDKPTALVIDLSEVEFLASVGMSVLAEANQRMAELGRFAVVAEGPATARPLTLCGLADVFAVHPTLEDALAGVSGVNS